MKDTKIQTRVVLEAKNNDESGERQYIPIVLITYKQDGDEETNARYQRERRVQQWTSRLHNESPRRDREATDLNNPCMVCHAHGTLLSAVARRDGTPHAK